jgi:hypothetical protein
VHVLDLISVFAFAVSGALMAIRRAHDVVEAAILAAAAVMPVAHPAIGRLSRSLVRPDSELHAGGAALESGALVLSRVQRSVLVVDADSSAS